MRSTGKNKRGYPDSSRISEKELNVLINSKKAELQTRLEEIKRKLSIIKEKEVMSVMQDLARKYEDGFSPQESALWTDIERLYKAATGEQSMELQEIFSFPKEGIVINGVTNHGGSPSERHGNFQAILGTLDVVEKNIEQLVDKLKELNLLLKRFS